MSRRYPIGAELVPLADARGSVTPQSRDRKEADYEGAHFRVWAPKRKLIEVVFEEEDRPGGLSHQLQREPDGYHAGLVPQAKPGMRYRFRLDGEATFPDPASRFQPQGPHGPSELIDPFVFHWTDGEWQGVRLEGQVIYEMHVGTFTREGTFTAARRELPELASLGVTTIEVMPIADFPGRFGWGYDGVGLFAPVALYGRPDDFRQFVDDAHRAGIGVILDVVYNHVGPHGNHLAQFSGAYFTTRYENDWGQAINYDGPDSAPVREWATTNARYWIEEFHLDGLRLDATQQIFDASPDNIMMVITREARQAAGQRSIIVIGENEPQETRLVRCRARGGYGMDALWNDDFHHSAKVAMTGRNEAYYTDYHGKPQELISAVKYGYLYQGQRYQWQKQRRGHPGLDLRPPQFVNFIENHDQVANSGRGERMHQLTSVGRFKAVTALLLLAPGTPMLFQGQEFAASTPFLYFADFEPELARKVHEGRIGFLAQFRSLAQPEMRACDVVPNDPATFARSKLDFADRQRNAGIYQLHKDLLRLRREDPAFRRQERGALDGAVLSNEALVLRYFGEDGDDRLLLVNLGLDLHLDPAPEPLLAPPENRVWDLLWSSEHPRYGGCGTPPLDSDENWRIPGHAAVVMRPIAEPERHG